LICFRQDGTLATVVRPGYAMDFEGGLTLGPKRVAARYVEQPEPGTELVGQVEVLEPFGGGEVPAGDPLPGATPGELKHAQVNQETFEKLAGGPVTIVWPPVSTGNTSGKVSMYVSVDRRGKVREAYPLNSDNAALQNAARDQLLKLQLKPAVLAGGLHVQAEAPLTFAFTTTMAAGGQGAAATPGGTNGDAGKPTRVLGRDLALVKQYPPLYPSDMQAQHLGGIVHFVALIGRAGEVRNLTMVDGTNPAFIEAATAAVQQWKYKPYLLNGAPVEVETKITVKFNPR
jgi:TonB family protein